MKHTAFIAMCALATTAAGAQRVRGVVTDSAGATPVAGAVVMLLDSAGRSTARTISGRDGRYSLDRATTAVRLRTLRIGFRPRDVALPRDAGDARIDIALAVLPVLLERVHVRDESRCPPRPDRSQALALWEQARDGLLATVVAREANAGEVELLHYNRRIDVRGDTTRQTVRRVAGLTSRPFLASRTASSFALQGYMDEEATARTYYGPDADVLLDEGFALKHCFHIEPENARHWGQIGLGFVPVNDKDSLVDVAGTLWIDRARPALRSMEFRYTGLEPAARDAGSGGQLSFREMTNGVALIDRWSILLPIMARSAETREKRWNRYDVRLVELEEVGGELAYARWPDGAEWEASLATLRGRVVSASDAKPVRGALVSLLGTTDSTLTDSTGSFVFHDVLPGPYLVTALDSVVANARPGQFKGTTVKLQRDSTATLTLQAPPRETFVNEVCRGQPRGDRDGFIVLARVVRADGSPVGQVKIAAEFGKNTRTGQSDSEGRFQICGVPPGGQLYVRITEGDLPFVDAKMQMPAGGDRITKMIVTLP